MSGILLKLNSYSSFFVFGRLLLNVVIVFHAGIKNPITLLLIKSYGYQLEVE